jgi:hypothetical protein
MSPRNRPAGRLKLALMFAAACAMLAGVDWTVGFMQRRALQAQKDNRARLDRLANYGIRFGIDDISFDRETGYRVRFRVQNAMDTPLYVLLPASEAYVQVGAGWVPEKIADVPGSSDEGAVLRLVDDHDVVRQLDVESHDYTELITGYMHLRLTLEAWVSPEEDPQEDIGERREDMFIYLRDLRFGGTATRDSDWAHGLAKPMFIPLRAWTLVPRGAK